MVLVTMLVVERVPSSDRNVADTRHTATTTHHVVPPLVIEPTPSYPPGTKLDKDGNPVSSVTPHEMTPTTPLPTTTVTQSPTTSPRALPPRTVTVVPVPRPTPPPLPPAPAPSPLPPPTSVTPTHTPPETVVEEPDIRPSIPQETQPRATTEPPVPTDEPPAQDFGGVPSHVARVGVFIKAQFNVLDVFGVGDRPNNPRSDHPKGLALDFMVYDDKAKGDAIRDCLMDHRRDWNITYVLWQVPDHFDHVHVSFAPSGVVRDLSCD
jgi:hypothetical protein